VTITEQLLAYFEPWMTDDLETFLVAVGDTFDEAASIYLWDPATIDAAGVDPDELDGDSSYGQLLDPDVTTPAALPWLAQFVGERFPVGISEADQREWTIDRPNSRRGTLLSIANAAQRSLIGNRGVTLIERSDGVAPGDSPDDVTVIVYAEECPNPAQVQRDLQDTFPLELSLTFQVTAGMTWQQLRVAGKTWNTIKVDSWGEMLQGRSDGIYFGK
jgi:hypothetical protein